MSLYGGYGGSGSTWTRTSDRSGNPVRLKSNDNGSTFGSQYITLRVANPPANLISLATLYGVSELLPRA